MTGQTTVRSSTLTPTVASAGNTHFNTGMAYEQSRRLDRARLTLLLRNAGRSSPRGVLGSCFGLGGAEVLDAARLERDWGGDQPQSVGAQVWATCRLVPRSLTAILVLLPDNGLRHLGGQPAQLEPPQHKELAWHPDRSS